MHTRVSALTSICIHQLQQQVMNGNLLRIKIVARSRKHGIHNNNSKTEKGRKRKERLNVRFERVQRVLILERAGKLFFYVEGPKTEKPRESTVVIRLVG